MEALAELAEALSQASVLSDRAALEPPPPPPPGLRSSARGGGSLSMSAIAALPSAAAFTGAGASSQPQGTAAGGGGGGGLGDGAAGAGAAAGGHRAGPEQPPAWLRFKPSTAYTPASARARALVGTACAADGESLISPQVRNAQLLLELLVRAQCLRCSQFHVHGQLQVHATPLVPNPSPNTIPLSHLTCQPNPCVDAWRARWI
jgi:hypothetical protein